MNMTDKQFIGWLLNFLTPCDMDFDCDGCDFDFDGGSLECSECMEKFARVKAATELG